MQYGVEFQRELPSLRRYARAVSGNQEAGDDLVIAALETLTRHRNHDPALSPRVVVFQALSRVCNTSQGVRLVETPGALDSGSDEDAVSQADRRLRALSPLSRQAFLLLAMEGFSEEEICSVMELSPDRLSVLLDEARREIAAQLSSNILIIEDELFVATELEELVTKLGHNVVAMATTKRDAIEKMRVCNADIILADIQLADGSSGIDAVNEILATSSVPVIFITAYPERLLTGQRPEPAFLIRKPFMDQEIRAAVSQALFFKEAAHHSSYEKAPFGIVA